MIGSEIERVRDIGRKLEDVREHITILKSEIALVETQFELILNDLAALVAK